MNPASPDQPLTPEATASALRAIREQASAETATSPESRAAWERVEAAIDLAAVSAIVPVIVDGDGALARLLRRVAGGVLRWQLQPMVERQNRFNAAVAQALADVLRAQQADARRRLQAEVHRELAP
jgi:hypothetical protein